MIKTKHNMNDFYFFLKVLIYLIFVFSGSFKWIPMPLDLTILSGILCFFVIIFELKRINLFNNLLDTSIILLLFFLNLFLLFSNIYSISIVYASSKSISVLLNLFTILYPIIVFKKSIFDLVKQIYLGLGVILISVLLYLYLNDLFVIFRDSSYSLSKVPTYLIVAMTLSTCFIFSFGYKSSLFLHIYRLVILFLIFQLGGRGPVLNLGIVMLVYFFLNSDLSITRLFKIKLIYKYLFFFSLFLVFFIIFNQEIDTLFYDEIDFTRFFSIDSYKGDESVLARANYLIKGVDSIIDNPIFGLGIGSSGLILASEDIFNYPHNLFVEAFMEIGIIGALSYLVIYFLFIFGNISKLKNNRNLLLIYLVGLLFFLEDNKSNSFDSWRLSIIWIVLFAIEQNRGIIHSKKISLID